MALARQLIRAGALPKRREGSRAMRRKLLVRLLMVGLAVACALESSSALRGAESAMMTRDTQESATGRSDGVAATQAFPQRPVRLIEPFGAGGGPDITARALAKELSRLCQ